MPNSAQRSQYEAKLAAAHRHLWWAAEYASQMGDEGAADDCMQINAEVSRLMSDSIKGKRRPRRQLSLVDSDCA